MTPSSYFIDTSALFKRYVKEAGSPAVNRLLDGSVPCYISMATLTEVVSNLRRLVDVDQVISNDEFKQVKESFLGEIGAGTLRTVPLAPAIILTSLEICSLKYVTPLDAIQLSSASSLGDDTFFVCSDIKLLRLAKHYGLQTLNPAEED
jgi:predicted nucleic acid-binding protein